jgi:hypothetical protein
MLQIDAMEIGYLLENLKILIRDFWTALFANWQVQTHLPQFADSVGRSSNVRIVSIFPFL